MKNFTVSVLHFTVDKFFFAYITPLNHYNNLRFKWYIFITKEEIEA